MANVTRDLSSKTASIEKAQTVSSVLDTVESLVQELIGQSERILNFVHSDPACDDGKESFALPCGLLGRLQTLKENLRTVSSYQSQIQDKLGM